MFSSRSSTSRSGTGSKCCGVSSASGPSTALQQGAQLGGIAAPAPSWKGSTHVARAVDADADQEMAGKGQAFGVPALGAGDMEIKDRQGDRQALAPLDHAHEVGVLQVVVGVAVAAIGIGPGDDLGELLRRRAAAVHQVGKIGRHGRHVLTERREVGSLVAAQHAERQRRLEQIETLAAIAGAERAQAAKLAAGLSLMARQASLRRPPDVGQMTRPKARDQHGIEAHRMGGIVRMARQEQAGGARRRGRTAGRPASRSARLEVGPRLDLDEGQDAAAPRDDVDLAELGLVAPRQDRIAGEPQPPHRAPFGDMAQPVGGLAGLGRHETSPRA